MSTSAGDKQELLSVLDQVFSKYFDEKDEFSREKTPQDKFWGTYLRVMKDEDEARPKDWDGNTGSILTFVSVLVLFANESNRSNGRQTGLFAATVAAFVIESYKSLSRDSGDQTVILLTKLLAATTDPSFNRTATSESIDDFHAPLPAVLANALWFVSLVVALACALLATLVQQWSRDYVRDVKKRDTLDEDFASRALSHIYIRMGVDRYGMDGVVNFIVGLVHLAVILFAIGLLLFLYPINAAVSGCTTFALGVFGLVYIVAGIMPIQDTSCPYRTPLTYPCALGYSLFIYLHPVAKSVSRYTITSTAAQWFNEFVTSVYNKALQQAKQTWSKIQSSLCLDSLSLPAGTYSISTRRRSSHIIWNFMTLARFKFAWRHASGQLINGDAGSLKVLLQSTLEILYLSRIRFECLDHLLDDDDFAYRLDGISHQRIGPPDSDLRVAMLKLTCLLLRRSYTRPDMWREDSEDKGWTITRYLLTLFDAIRNPRDADDSTHSDLPLQFCLFHLRWSLLLLARDSPAILVPDYETMSFNEVFFTKDHSDNNSYDLFHKHQLRLELPKALLLLLNSWQYNAIDAIEPRSSHTDWNTDTSSCLVSTLR